MSGNNIHSQITDSDEIHVPKGFTEADNNTGAMKNALGQLEWRDIHSFSEKSNFTATTNPTVNDDSSQDYTVGSRWANVSHRSYFVCVDATVGAAVWLPIIVTNGTAIVDPTVTDDVTKGYIPGSVWVNTADGNKVWMCAANPVGAAEWKSLTSADVVGFDHRTLSHLDADDHLQYLHRDGSRPMAGDLDMDGYKLTNVLQINGVVIPEQNVLRVRKVAGDAEYESVADAIAAISGASSSNPFVVDIGPGVFTEPSFTVPPFVDIIGAGIDSTRLVAANPNAVFITIQNNISISYLDISGATGINGVLIDIVPTVHFARILMHFLRFGTCNTAIRCFNPSFSALINAQQCGTIPTSTFKKVIHLESHTQPVSMLVASNTMVQATNDPAAITFDVSGEFTFLAISGSLSRYAVGAGGTHIKLYDGAAITINGLALDGGDVALYVPNEGDGPTINATGITAFTPDVAADILHPDIVGSIQGNASVQTSTIDPSVQNLSLFITDPDGQQYLAGDIFERQPNGTFTDTSTINKASTTVGLLSDGAMTHAGGVDLFVAEGLGYILDSDDNLIRINWSDETITLPTDSVLYIYVDANEDIQFSLTQPNVRENVFLGRVVTNSVTTLLIDASGFNAVQATNAISDMIREGLSAIYVSGSDIVEVGTRNLDISAGTYYFGELKYITQGGNPAEFTTFYQNGSGGYIHAVGETTVDNAFYDDGSGTLAPLTSGYYAKHSLYAIGTSTGGYTNEGYFLIYAQAEYNALALAEQAPLPNPPAYLSEAVALIGSIIVQEGVATIVQIRDERPIPLARRSSTIAANTFHHNLLGLNDFDDHLRYLPVNGARPMTANLDMDTFNIVDVGTINGVLIEDHSARHQPGGADALATAAAATQLADQVNAEGVSTFFARADHVHNIPTAVAIGMGANTSNTQGVSTNLSKADHQHAIASGAPSTQTPDQTNTTGTSNNFARADHIHNIPTAIAVGITANSVNGIGSSGNFSRADHTHFLLTGTPSTQTPNQTNTTGTAAGVARADHIHNIPTAAPTTPLSATTVDADGAGAAFARNDHSHSIITGTPSTQNADQANAAGAAAELARADHVHNIPTAIAVSVGAANTQGASINFSKADHVHQGVHSIKANAGSQRYNDTSLVDGNGVTVVDDGSGNFTLDTTIGANEFKVTSVAGLTVNYSGGRFQNGVHGTAVNVPSGSLVVAASSSGYIYVQVNPLNSSLATVTSSTTPPPASALPIATFTSTPSVATTTDVRVGLPTISLVNSLRAYYTGSGLSASWNSGSVRINGTFFNIAAGSLALTANTVIGALYVDSTGVVAANTTGTFPALSVPMATYSTNATAITALNGSRSAYMPNIVFAAPSTVTTASTNTEGTSGNFARADHVHQVTLSNSRVASISQISTASLTDVVMTGQTLTPAAGTYLVRARADVSATSNNRLINMSIYSNGVLVSDSQVMTRIVTGNATFGNDNVGNLTTDAIVTVNGSQAIDMRWRTSGGTALAQGYSLTILRIS